MAASRTVPKLSFIAMALLALPQYVIAADLPQHNVSAQKPQAATPVGENKSASQKAAAELSKRRETLVNEAMAANGEILQAIDSLKKSDKAAAFKSLTDASGKLDVVLARAPGLKLAPINLRTDIADIVVSPDEVRRVVAQAKSQLDEGRVQAVRSLLRPLTSEIRVLTDSLPLETYPAAIKLASKEIQNGNLMAAERTLYNALSTIVTNEEIIPLPPVKAEEDVLQAERLIQKDKSKNQDQALALLAQAKQQLELGKLLGYSDYKELRSEVDSVRGKIKNRSPDASLFGRLKALFHKASGKK